MFSVLAAIALIALVFEFKRGRYADSIQLPYLNYQSIRLIFQIYEEIANIEKSYYQKDFEVTNAIW